MHVYTHTHTRTRTHVQCRKINSYFSGSQTHEGNQKQKLKGSGAPPMTATSPKKSQYHCCQGAFTYLRAQYWSPVVSLKAHSPSVNKLCQSTELETTGPLSWCHKYQRAIMHVQNSQETCHCNSRQWFSITVTTHCQGAKTTMGHQWFSTDVPWYTVVSWDLIY